MYADDYAANIADRLRLIVDDLPRASADACRHHLAGGGKMLRGRLAVTSAAAAGGPPAAALDAAVAVELVHNFSLLHDDVMDGDVERRGRPAAWTTFGSPVAILAGTALLVEAVRVLRTSLQPGVEPSVTRLLGKTQQLIRGQDTDLRFEKAETVSIEECLAMAADKTASLFACASAIGAELVGAPEALVDALDAYGENLGLAYQLVNDSMDLWDCTADRGRAKWSDIRARKMSLPVVAAFSGESAAAEELRSLYARPAAQTDEECQRVAGLIESAGGREWVNAKTVECLNAARRSLNGLDIPEVSRTELIALADGLEQRATC